MILPEIKQYLMKHRRAALRDLSIHFDADPDSMRDMLNQWIRKGKVRKFTDETQCGEACCKCDSLAVEIYEWVA